MSLADVSWRPPPIETPRLLLRGYQPGDAGDIYAYAGDPDVTPFMAWNRHRGPEDARTYLDSEVAAAYRGRQLDYAVCVRGSQAPVIGGIGLYWRSSRDLVMELGYVLHKSYWGRGLMPEAARALMRFAFTTTPVERIYAPVFEPNAKSRRAAEKMGMTLDGVLRSNVALRGRRWDEAIYSILRAEARKLAEPTGPPPGARLAARVLLVDADERVLLLEAEAPDGRRFWLAPGGGLDSGEGFEAAAQRELVEETGVEPELGPWIWTRRHLHWWSGELVDQYERFFVARVPRGDVAPRARDDYVVGHRWWALAEIESSSEDFAPRALARLLPAILAGDYPEPPIDCGV